MMDIFIVIEHNEYDTSDFALLNTYLITTIEEARALKKTYLGNNPNIDLSIWQKIE